MRKMIAFSIVCDKEVKDLAQMIAQRAWTIDGVRSVEVAHEFPSKDEPRPTPCPVPDNVWAELPHVPGISFAEAFEKIFTSLFGKK